LSYEVLLSLAVDPFTWTNRSIPSDSGRATNLNALWHAIFFSNLVFLVVLLFLISYAEIVRITKDVTLKQDICKQLQTGQPNSRWTSGLRCA